MNLPGSWDRRMGEGGRQIQTSVERALCRLGRCVELGLQRTAAPRLMAHTSEEVDSAATGGGPHFFGSPAPASAQTPRLLAPRLRRCARRCAAGRCGGVEVWRSGVVEARDGDAALALQPAEAGCVGVSVGGGLGGVCKYVWRIMSVETPQTACATVTV
eukprot:365650-Chlamydomonas_euryale.AAC.3